MSPSTEPAMDFERRARAVLEEDVLRIDGRIRSRLNQARQAAVAEAAKRRPALWRLQQWLSILTAWCIVPLTLFLFW